jgi:hypothetical protein
LTWRLPPEFALGTLNQDTVKLATAKLFFMRYPWGETLCTGYSR